MARGRQQKWICKDCKSEFCIQGQTPKFCCSCGSCNIGRAPSYELVSNFEDKRRELESVCGELNIAFQRYSELKDRYDGIMAYWKQQRRRGYISAEEYLEMAMMFDGTADKNKKTESSDSCGS